MPPPFLKLGLLQTLSLCVHQASITVRPALHWPALHWPAPPSGWSATRAHRSGSARVQDTSTTPSPPCSNLVCQPSVSHPSGCRPHCTQELEQGVVQGVELEAEKEMEQGAEQEMGLAVHMCRTFPGSFLARDFQSRCHCTCRRTLLGTKGGRVCRCMVVRKSRTSPGIFLARDFQSRRRCTCRCTLSGTKEGRDCRCRLICRRRTSPGRCFSRAFQSRCCCTCRRTLSGMKGQGQVYRCMLVRRCCT